ncbi:hypothetical protein OQA88_9463 [Cercophora sp. LCS_1]
MEPAPHHDVVMRPPSLKTADGATDDVSDDGSVIFVSENPAAQEDDNTAFYSKAEDGDGDDNILEALAGAQLPGTNFRLHPYQMEAVYEQLQRSFGKGLGGGIMALDTGLGKTVVTLAVVAVMRLAELNAAEVQGVHEEHRPGPRQGSQRARHDDGLSLEQPLGHRVLLPPGPSLVLTPANVVEQFARQGSAYLARSIQLPGSASHMSFVDVIDTSPAGASLPNKVQARHPPRQHPEYLTPKVGKPLALVPGSGSEMAYTAAQKSRLCGRHRLIVVSSNPPLGHRKRVGMRLLCRAYWLRQQRRATLVKHIVEWAVAPRFVVLDEFLTAKDGSTKVFQGTRSDAEAGACRPRLQARSAERDAPSPCRCPRA